MLASTGRRFFASTMLVIFSVPALCAASDAPTSDIAQTYLSGRVGSSGKVWNLKLSGCTGDDVRQSCHVVYNRSFFGNSYREELEMDFERQPSGWSAIGYNLIKTDKL